MAMWSLEEESAFREDLISKVIATANEGDGMLSRTELGKFHYAGVALRVIDSQGGIWNPGSSWPFPDKLRTTLSINTTNSKKYLDEEIHGGLWRYDYQSGGTGGKNTKMRQAMELQFPLLWFREEAKSRYVPYKVFVIEDFPEKGFCHISPDLSLTHALRSESLIERRYAERTIRQRLHQPAFRARVISAYETRCSICQIRHGSLLDAAHITADSDETTSTSVTNGLSLCKIHHAAYDSNILGIDSSYVVHVRVDVLKEIDGPMLLHGIQEMDNRDLWVPKREKEQPDLERLGKRFAVFAELAE